MFNRSFSHFLVITVNYKVVLFENNGKYLKHFLGDFGNFSFFGDKIYIVSCEKVIIFDIFEDKINEFTNKFSVCNQILTKVLHFEEFLEN